MKTVTSHDHFFSPSEWRFADPTNAVAISTRRVFREGLPVLLVTHDWDGDWQILCGTTTEADQAMVVCLGCAYQRDPSIGQLADMPRGWRAWRSDARSLWERERMEPEEDCP